MEKLISSFEEYDWSLDLNRYTEAADIEIKFGYENKKYKQKNFIQSYLVEDIKKKLIGNKISSFDYRKLINHFSLRYYTYHKKKDKEIYFIFYMVNFLGCKLDTYTENIKSWLEVKELIEAYISLGEKYDYLDEIYDYDKKATAESINYLTKKGFAVDIINGEAILKKHSERSIQIALKYRIGELGCLAIINILRNIEPKYNPQMDRYFLRPEPPTSLNFKPSIPWGYLFKISIPFFGIKNKKTHKSKNQFKDIIDISKHYFSIKQLQDTNKFQDIEVDNSSVLQVIQRNILFDQHFSIDQISVSNFGTILRGMFLSSRITSISINLLIYFDIFEWVSSFDLKKHYPLFFDIETLQEALSYKYNTEDLNRALNELSFDSRNINKDYISPNEIEKANYYQKPFIKNNNIYAYINPLICSYGFYYVFEQILLKYGYDREILGI